MIHVFLSHDIDWGRNGAPISHIMARKERFEDSVIKNYKTRNPYYNLKDLVLIDSLLRFHFHY